MQHCGKVMLGALSRNILCGRSSGFITCNFHFSRYLSNYPQNVLKSIKNVSVDKIVKNVKEERKVPLKGLATVLTKIDFANLTSAEAISLLNCCGNAIPTASSKTRSQTCRLIYEYLVKHEKINLDIFHNYIKICNENLEPVDYQQCLKTFKLNPTKETYQLVLENVCEQGDIDQAYNILEAMRDREMSVNEDVFNSLVLGHVLQGGLSAAESILQTMKTAHIAETNATKMNLFKGLLRRKDYDDFKKCLHKYPIRLSDHEFLLMLEYIGVTGNLDLFKEVEFLFSNVVLTHELQVKVEDVCFYLIHMDQVKAAIQIYEKLVTFEVDRAYGEVILKEMLHCNTDINEIISIAKQIREDGKNKTILENLTGFALQHGYVEASWKLLNHIAVRCHYFWPLFILAGKSDGEKGVFSVIEKMKSFNLKPDAETLEVYIFPYCNLDSLKMLVSKFKKHDFTAKEVVSPLATLLLKKNMVKDAYGLCTSYNVNVANPDASNVLARAWKATYDSQTIVKLLKIYSESVDADNNLIQNFLVKSVEMCRSDKAYRNFLNLNEIIKSHNFRISFPTGNNITQLLEKCPEEIKDKIKDVINSMLDVSHNMNVEETLIPHPRKMSTQQLECHLIELEEKNMETRGVLRRLIQMHSREGNVKRIGELRTKLQNLGYEESPGMKSLIMHNYVLAGQLDDALDLYSELKREHPEFILDSYKSIDLATLMVEKLRFEEALTMLEAECKKLNRINPENLVRNCRKLLMSCTKDDEQMMLFDLLLKAGLCRPTNIILGPLMRTYLIRDDLTAAVDKFTEFAQKYGCTPLQRELLSAVSKTQNSELLEKVLRATQKVHGAGPAQVGLIAALAESGQVKPLKKVLVQTNLVIKPLLERECKRWMEENNVAPLLALSQAGERLPNNVISLTFVYNCILEIYGNKNDINAISNFSDALPEDYIDKPKLEKKILYLLGKNNNVSNPKSLNVTL